MLSALGDAALAAHPVVYVALSVSVLVAAVRRRDRTAAALVAALLFVASASVVRATVGLDPGSPVTPAHHLGFAALTLFPLCLFEFAHALRRAATLPRLGAAALTAATIAAQASVEVVPDTTGSTAAGAELWGGLLVLSFVAVGGAAVIRLLAVGRRAGGVVRSRMRLLASGSAAMIATVALSSAAGAAGGSTLGALAAAAVAWLGVAAPIMFIVGYMPPAVLRHLWRRETLDELTALADQIARDDSDDVTLYDRLLDAAGRLIGASGLWLVDADGREVGRAGVSTDGGHAIEVPVHGGRLTVVESRRAPWYGTDERQLLQQVSVYASFALQRSERQALLAAERIARAEAEQAKVELAAAAATDPLTGLRNRRGLLDLITPVLANAHRRDAAVGVIAIDLDNFKAINDDGGHAAGDEALVAVAAVLERHTRASDIVARVGGDEFLVICESGNHQLLTDRLRRALGKQLRALAGRDDVGASVGHVLIEPSPEVDLEVLIGLADAAMYLDKRGRRPHQLRTPGSGAAQGRHPAAMADSGPDQTNRR